MSYWCYQCNIIHLKKELCYFCKLPLVNLQDHFLEDKGNLKVCCSHQGILSFDATTVNIGRKQYETALLFDNHLSVLEHHATIQVEDKKIRIQKSHNSKIFIETTEGIQLLQHDEQLVTTGETILLTESCLCKVWLKWTPFKRINNNTFYSDAEISLQQQKNSIGQHHILWDNKLGHYFVDKSEEPSQKNVTINNRLVITRPLDTGDRINIVGAEYEYQQNALVPVSPLKPIDITLQDITIKNRLHIKNLEITSGEFIGILGKSGTGKSTLIKIITGWIKPHEGSIVRSYENDKLTANKVNNYIAYVPQYDIVHENLTVFNSLLYTGLLYKKREKTNYEKIRQQVQQILLQVDLGEVKKSKISDLSGGQRKRVNIAHALMQSNSSLLVLDEPTSGLDLENDYKIMKLLQRFSLQGRTVICITHHLASMKLFDKIVLLQRVNGIGQIKDQGSPYEVLSVDENKSLINYSGLSSLYEVKDKLNTNSQNIVPIKKTSWKLKSQWWTMLKRRIDEFIHPKGSWINLLSMLLFIPVFIGLVITIAHPSGAAGNTRRLFLCSVAVFWLGMSVASREFSKARYRIFLHEKTTNIKAKSVLISSVIFYICISFIQTFFLACPSIYLLSHEDRGKSFTVDKSFISELQSGKLSSEFKENFKSKLVSPNVKLLSSKKIPVVYLLDRTIGKTEKNNKKNDEVAVSLKFKNKITDDIMFVKAINHLKDLNNKTISVSLKKEFEKQAGLSISDDAYIEVQETSKIWRIVDQKQQFSWRIKNHYQKQYRIVKKQKNLEVSSAKTPKQILFTLDIKFAENLDQKMREISKNGKKQSISFPRPHSILTLKPKIKIEKVGKKWLFIDQKQETFTVETDLTDLQINYDHTSPVPIFFGLVWLMGICGTIAGLLASVIESQSLGKIPVTVSVPCLTVVQFLFSKMVIGNTGQLSYDQSLLHTCYNMTFSKYIHEAFLECWKTKPFSIVDNDFFLNLNTFCIIAIVLPTVFLLILLKKAKAKEGVI